MKNAFSFQMVKMQYCTPLLSPPPSSPKSKHDSILICTHRNIHKNQRFVISEKSLNCSHVHNKKIFKNPLTFILLNDICILFLVNI